MIGIEALKNQQIKTENNKELTDCQGVAGEHQGRYNHIHQSPCQS